MSNIIPSTGRLGSLAKTIAEETSKKILDEVFQDFNPALKGQKQAEWVLTMIKKLEQKVGLELTINIIEQNGRESCGKGFKNTVIKLMNKADSVKDFVSNLQEHYKRSSFFEFIDDNTLIGGHRKCFTMIKSALKPIDSQIFCHYCVGHGKEFYEAAFGKSVNAQIIKTVMTGGDTCKFKFCF